MIIIFISNLIISFLIAIFFNHKIKKELDIASKKVLSPYRFYGYSSAIIYKITMILFLISVSIFNIHTEEIIFYNTICTIITCIILFKVINRNFNSREFCDNTLKILISFIAIIAAVLTIGIIYLIVFKSVDFFKIVNINDFLLKSEWLPDNSNPENSFGILSILKGTVYLFFITIVIAAPVSLMSSIAILFYSGHPNIIRSIFNTMASIPSIVYGFIAIVVLSPIIMNFSFYLEIDSESENTLTAIIAMIMMILPFLISSSIEVLKSFPKTSIEAAFGLGISLSETIRKIILPASIKNLLVIYIIAISRVIGETMIVSMALGMNAGFSFNLLKSITTFTIQIVSAVTGDSDFNSPTFLSAFAISALLLIFTSALNSLAYNLSKNTRKK